VISFLNSCFCLNHYLDIDFHDGLYRSIYYAASDVELLRPMVDVTWAPMLVAFSVPLDKSEDEVVTFQCLEGFRHAVHITAVLCMRTQRDAFLTSLAKFTSLHSAADIKQKNIDAIKVLGLLITGC
jgi:brefeldin A-inhibited guanine nucleotide-exchange protein